MGYVCCVPECKSGYRSAKQKVALFGFPKESGLRQKWIDAIPRKSWVLSSNHRVCAKHFAPDDFVRESCDLRARRKRKRDSVNLERLRLKPAVVPHLFPALPSYLSTPSRVPRSSTSSASSRLEKDNIATEKLNALLLQKETVENIGTLKKKMKCEIVPSGYTVVETDASLEFHIFSRRENFLEPPKLLVSVIVANTMELSAFIHSAYVPSGTFEHLMSSKFLKTTSELLNVLALCKELSDGLFNDRDSDYYIDLAITILESHNIPGSVTSDMIEFVVEQLRLLRSPKTGRRYSTSLVTTALLWKCKSPALYQHLQKFFALPSVSHLRKRCAGLNVEPKKVDLNYLKNRTRKIKEEEKIVTLMVDEVYTAHRVEYSNGKFIGLTDDGVPAKTVLAFMVQSIRGSYKDVICLVPVNKLNTTTLHKWFIEVLRAIDDYLLVVAVSVDNHICNR